MSYISSKSKLLIMNIENIPIIPIIPITGPPCSGKTSVLSCIREELLSMGHTPIIIPESFSTLAELGFDASLFENDIELQKYIFHYQMMQENYCKQYAQKILRNLGKKPVIICDRSLLDGKAYVHNGDWEIVLDELNVKQTEISHRYQASLYLETAPRQFFTHETNRFRKETYEEARELGEKIKTAYLTSHLWQITNRGDFETKKQDAIGTIKHILGYPEPIEDELKFEVLSPITPQSIKTPFVYSQITQHYLNNFNNDGLVERVRRRDFPDGVTIFTHTKKNRSTKVELEEMISTRQYYQLLARAIPGKKPIIKDRYCFIWKNQYFELDFFIDSKQKPLLELERTKLQLEYVIPEWIGEVIDVTNDPLKLNENM